MITEDSLILLADASEVGSYVLILRDLPDAVGFKCHVTGKTIRLVYYPSHLSLTEVAELFRYFPVSPEFIPYSESEESDLIVVRPTPKWLRSELNYNSIVEGEYNRIYPVTAEVVPALRCVFRCAQCSYSVPKMLKGIWKRGDKASGHDPISNGFCASEVKMDIETMLCVIRRLHEGKVENVLITGGGEPLTNSAVTIAGMTEARRLGMKSALYTNGLLLSENISREILVLHPLFVRVSIYGATESSFERYTRRKGKYFAKVLTN